MPYTIAKLARKVGVSICTVHRHIKQELLWGVWTKIYCESASGKRTAHFGWLIEDGEASKYESYIHGLVGFRSDGKLPSKRILEMHESGMTPEEIAREAKIKPASVLRTIRRKESLQRRRKWLAQNSSQATS